MSPRAPTRRRHAARLPTLAAATLIAGVIAAAGCSVEYHPGGGRTDTAAGDAASTPRATRDSAAPVGAPPLGPAPMAGVTRVPEDSLEGLGPDAAAAAAAPKFPRTAADSAPPVGPGDIATLRAHAPIVPVYGVRAADLHSNFAEARGGGSRPHQALDIMAARGTPVLAADDGRVVKLFASKAGGTTAYVVSPDNRYMFYYAHLDRYRDGLAEGQTVRKGDPIGFVGSTGDASPEAPHLHFAIARVADPAWWWTGTAIDPYVVLKP